MLSACSPQICSNRWAFPPPPPPVAAAQISCSSFAVLGAFLIKISEILPFYRSRPSCQVATLLFSSPLLVFSPLHLSLHHFTCLFATSLVSSPLNLSLRHLTFLFTCLSSILKAPHSALLFSPTPQAPQHTSKTSSSLATLFSEWTATGSSLSFCSLPPSTSYLCPSFSHAPPQHPRHERRECARAHPGPHRHYGISSIMPAPLVSLIPSGRCSRHSALAPPHPPSPLFLSPSLFPPFLPGPRAVRPPHGRRQHAPLRDSFASLYHTTRQQPRHKQ
jgi:hypothetical protein